MDPPRPRIRIQNFTGEEIDIVLIQIKIHIPRLKLLQIMQTLNTHRIIINDRNFKGMLIQGQNPDGDIKIQAQFQPHICTDIRTYLTTIKELDGLEIPWTTLDT